MKKTISGLLALILVLSLCAGCGDAGRTPDQTPDQAPEASSIYTDLLGVDPNEAALETGGNQIPMELYLYWLTYSCSSMEYQLNMLKTSYGMYGELVNDDGTVKWEESLEGTPVGQVAKDQAESNALSYAVLENVAAANGVSMTEEDMAQLEEDKAAYIEQLGGQEAFVQSLKEMGVSEESFDRVSSSSYLYNHLLELAQDPSSSIYQAPTDDNAYVDHILLSTRDSQTNEPLSDEEIAARKAKAEELLAQLQESSDLVTLFTQLAEEHGEDPGRATDAGYLINPDTSFVQEFKDAAFALKPGELSGIVESDYGYHILLRKELGENQLSTLAAENLAGYLDGEMSKVRESVVRSETLESIDVGKFFTDYKAAVEAMHPAEDAADGSDTGVDGSDTGVDGGDTGADDGDTAAAPESAGNAAE